MRKIRKGDVVMALRGNDKGETGKVLDIDTKNQKALVEGLNLKKKHIKRTAKNLKAGIDDIPAPLPMCSLSLVSKKDGKPVRVRFEVKKSGNKSRKVRVAVRTGEVFD